jgi:hypothetical protein
MYTSEQYALLETFEKGGLVQDLTEDELYTYQFLMQNNLLQPRADIEDGLHLLSERGKMLLESHRISEQQKKELLEDKVKQRAEAKKEKVSGYFHDIFLLFLGGAITVFFENIGAVCKWLCSIFK